MEISLFYKGMIVGLFIGIMIGFDITVLFMIRKERVEAKKKIERENIIHLEGEIIGHDYTYHDSNTVKIKDINKSN